MNAAGRSAGFRPRLVAIAVGFAAVLVAGCTSKKQEATEELHEAVKKCRAADGPVYQAPIMQGSDETPVLTAACAKKMGDVKMADEFTAEMQVGPYTWEAGLDQSIGVWTIKAISWEPLDQARSHLEGDPGKNELQRAIEKLRQAQKEFPESSWVRLKLLDALLKRRIGRRKPKKSGLKIGKPIEKHVEATVEWARNNEDFDTAARARLEVVDYYEGFVRQIRESRSALGSQDGWYENAIEVAEDEGDDEKAEQYRKELEKLKKKRPKKKRRYSELIQKGETQMCGTLAHLKTDGIDDEKLKNRVETAKGSTNCRKLLEQPGGGGGTPGGGSGDDGSESAK